MMKKKVMIIAAAIVIVGAAVLAVGRTQSWQPRSYTVDGEGYSAQVVNGNELILDLDANPTTGYSWVITSAPEQFASDYDNYVQDEAEEDMTGVGGTQEYHIVALNDGTGTMTLEYKQDWDGGESDGTYELKLEISRHKKTQLQIDSVTFEKVE